MHGITHLRDLVEPASRAQAIFDCNDRSVEHVTSFCRRLRLRVSLRLLLNHHASGVQCLNQPLQLLLTFIQFREGCDRCCWHVDDSVVWW